MFVSKSGLDQRPMRSCSCLCSMLLSSFICLNNVQIEDSETIVTRAILALLIDYQLISAPREDRTTGRPFIIEYTFGRVTFFSGHTRFARECQMSGGRPNQSIECKERERDNIKWKHDHPLMDTNCTIFQ